MSLTSRWSSSTPLSLVQQAVMSRPTVLLQKYRLLHSQGQFDQRELQSDFPHMIAGTNTQHSSAV